MSASLSGVFNCQEFTDLGALMAGGRLYTYAPATTTQKVAYTDPAGTIPHTYTSDGLGGQYLALNSRGELPAPLFLASGGYDLTLKTLAGVTVWTRRAVGNEDAAGSVLAQLTAYIADLANTTDATKGDDLLGVKLVATGSAARTQHDKNAEFVSLTDFAGADPTGVADSAAAIDAWLTYCYANNVDGYAPPGTYLTSTGHTLTYSASKKFQIRGAGCGATTFRKTGANTGAVFKFTISSGSFLELNLHLSDFAVEAPGLSAVNGIEFDAAALVTMTRIRGNNCAIGMKGFGLLVSVLQDVDFSNNATGMQFRRATAGSQPYANLVVLHGRCRANGNVNWGLDYGQGSGLIIKGFLDAESNGTAGDTGTGGIIIRDTIDDEFGVGVVDIDGLWLESNKGHSFIMQGASNAHLRMNNVTVLSQESTRAITIGAIRSATFSAVNATSANADLVCQAEQQHYLGGVQVFGWNATGATLLTGQVKTNASSGNVWEASTARIGSLEVSTTFQGTVDGALDVGAPGRRCKVVYATTGAINTSDEDEKEQFRAQTAAEQAAALEIKADIRAFKFKDAVALKGSAARWHFGVGAQSVAAILTSHGLDAHAYGFLCYDEWGADATQEAGSRWGIRYDELAMFILSAT